MGKLFLEHQFYKLRVNLCNSSETEYYGRQAGRSQAVKILVNRVFIKLAVDQSIFIPFGLFFLGAVLQL